MDIEELSKRVALALSEKNYTFATAEECTCGLVGASVASQNSAQPLYKGSIVVYTSDVAMKILEIPSYVIARNDFVSSQVACHMALNTMYKLGVSVCTSVVGYPDGYGHAQVCVAKLCNNAVDFKYERLDLNDTDRGKNIERCIKKALMATLEHVMDEKKE